MDTIRNFIHIVGITPENELPDKALGQMIQYSDIETLYIPEDKPPAKSIFQIIVQVEITSTRIINAPLFKTMAVDGIKKFKIIYTEKGGSDNAGFAVLEVPYNTFIELPKEYDNVNNLEIFIVDAYFSLVDSRKIYSYILYLVHVCHASGASEKQEALPRAAFQEMLIYEQPAEENKHIDDSDKNASIQNSLVDIDSEYL